MLCFFHRRRRKLRNIYSFFAFETTNCSIFITNPSRSCQLRWWRLPQALKILKYQYIPYLFVKVNFGYFSFFTLKTLTSLWQFRFVMTIVYILYCPFLRTRLRSSGFAAFSGISHVFPLRIAPSILP